jgi:putative restriction endonuclease
MRDEDVRASCFGQLAVLCAQFGEDVPYRGGLDAGFAFRGRRVPYLSPQKGIFRAAVQRGPAALSIQTSANSPYRDVETPDGFLYDYRAGSVDQPDNRALRAAHELQVPLVYFVGTRPGWYRPNYPFFVIGDDPASKQVLVAPGAMVGPVDELEPILPEDPIERRYAVREVRVRIHQARFRGRVVPAYRGQCAICRLKEIRLLDAAHIVGDIEEEGDPVVSNGLALCSIHHRAFDHDLVAVSPDYEVRVSERLLHDDDGPMLELLKTFDRNSIYVPRRAEWKPDRERLAARFERFLASSAR